MWLQDGPGRVWDGGPTAPLKGSYCPAPPPSGTINYGPQSTALSKIKSTLQSPLPKAHTTYPPPSLLGRTDPPPPTLLVSSGFFNEAKLSTEQFFLKECSLQGRKGKGNQRCFHPISLYPFKLSPGDLRSGRLLYESPPLTLHFYPKG